MRKLIWVVLALPLAACVTDLSWLSLPKTEVAADVGPPPSQQAPVEVAEVTPPPPTAPATKAKAKTKTAKKPKPASAEKQS